MATIKKSTACLLASVAVFALTAQPALGREIIKTKFGDWKDPTNWDPMMVPRVNPIDGRFSDDAIIRADTTVGEDFVAVAKTVALEANLTISKKGTLNVGTLGSLGFAGTTLLIGTADANATLTVSGKDAVLRLGTKAASLKCPVSVCLGAVNAGGGVVSTGTLDISDGGAVIFDVASVAASNANLLSFAGSSLNISGANSRFINPGGLDIRGNLNVVDTATLLANRLSIFSTSVANLSNSIVELQVLDIGGNVSIKNGTKVTVRSPTDINTSRAGNSGVLVVEGFSSSLTTRTLRSIGSTLNPEIGKITVRDGGRIQVDATAFIGFEAELVVSGERSLFFVPRTDKTAGRYAVLVGESAKFTVENGGTANVESALIGTNEATFGLVIREPGPATMLVTGTNSSLIVTDALIIGADSDRTPGFLRVSDGGKVQSRTGNIGQFTTFNIGISGNGDAIVTGSGSRWTVDDRLIIGPASSFQTLISGTLTLAEGGLLSAKVVDLGDVVEDVNTLAAGIITIGSAPGSAAVRPGFLQIETDVNIGKYGTINFNHNSDAYRFSTTLESVRAGNGAVINWNGSTILDGDLDRYTGAVAVNGGVLTIDSQMGSSSVAVNASGRLTGQGGVAGTISVNPAGTLAGRQGTAPLTMQTLLMQQGARLDIALTGALTPNPIFDVRGNVTLNGSINITANPTLGQGLYRIINYGGSLTDNVLDIGTVSAGLDAAAFSVFLGAPGQVNLLFGGESGGAQNVIGNGNGRISIGGSGWLNAGGNAVLLRTGDFLILSGTGGALTVDESGGAIDLGLYQFASNGFVVNGDPITLNAAQTVFRVGDGSAQSAGMTATINSGLFGTGGIKKTDLGTLILNGVNRYGGGTTISGGTLRVASDAALGSVTGGVVIDGGSLQSTGPINSARSFTIGSQGGTLDTGDTRWAFSGQLLGTGQLVKIGGGALVLSGDGSAFGGTLSVNAGLLQISAPLGGRIINESAVAFASNGALVYAGNVSGSGTLEQRGPGMLTLSGVHSYSGTTTVSGGTLANTGTIIGATSVQAAGTLTNAGTVAGVTNAGTGTNSGTMGALNNIAGSFTNNGMLNGSVANSAGATFATTATINGSLTNSGTAQIGGVINGTFDNRAGTVTATGAVTGIGALTQAAGATLNLNGFALTAGSLAGDGSVQLGVGTLTSGGANASTTFAGVVSGAGRIVKTGTGQLTLTGANIYTGGTTVAAGTLVGNAMSLQGVINNEGRVRFDQSTAGSYAGVLSGSGMFEKAGAGRLDLTGTSPITGSTLVSGGELAVNGSLARSAFTIGTGARLGGSGTVGGIVAQSGSIVAPGNSVGTLTVQGNVAFASGSTFAVEVQGAVADRIAATGTAQLAGTLAVTAVGGPYTFALPYVLLSAAGGRTGTFDATTGLAGFGPGIRPTVSYDATTVTLRLDPNALGPLLTGVALTSNQRSAQTRFDAAIASGTTNAVPFFPIFNLPLGQLPTALDALSAEVHASAARQALDDERMVRKSTLDQLRSVGGSGGKSAWGAVFGTFGKIASDGNAARITRDTTGFITGIDTGGAFGGADIGWRVGVQGHYARTTFGIADRASSGSIERVGGGIHGALQFDGLALRAGTSLASVKLKTTRTIAATGFSEQATAAPRGTALQAFGEIGYRLGDERASVEPFAGVALSQLRLGNIAESGGVSSVTVKARTYTLTIADLGVRGRLRLTPGDKAAIDLKAALAVRQTLGSPTFVSNIAFASAPALDFGIASVAQDRTSFVPEVGIDAELGAKVSINLSYSGAIGKLAQDHGVKAGLRVAF